MAIVTYNNHIYVIFKASQVMFANVKVSKFSAINGNLVVVDAKSWTSNTDTFFFSVVAIGCGWLQQLLPALLWFQNLLPSEIVTQLMMSVGTEKSVTQL